MEIVRQWFRRYLSDPQVIILAVLLIAGFAVVLTFGGMLAPVLAGVVIAYLLEGVVAALERFGMPRLAAVLVVFVLFVLFLVFALFGLLPLLSNQIAQLLQQLPNMVAKGQKTLLRLPELYPNFITEHQVSELMTGIRGELATWGQHALSVSVASLVGVITLLVYVILVPVLVFFFLKDKDRILQWVTGYLPRDRDLAATVWRDVNAQIGNYVRGKVWEILIVGVVTYAVFALMGLQYALLLATLVGFSVIIPYIGAAVVTVPVALIAYFQWGLSADFLWVVAAYGVIQALDGNILVPLLFSEVVNLHPVAIIMAVLIFGGVWGFWGVFFAIPLATLVQAVLKAWPRAPLSEEEETGLV
ncbi:MAG TPA: AI-2E family transporter [Gammaproteobacteria bacterium]|nr:AI-2E family transporter [Gammaproteobacteria bacterium]